MYSGLLIVLLPFFMGYAIKLTRPASESRIHTALNWLVYLILFLMGVSLAQLDNIGINLQTIMYTTVVFFIFTFGFNFIVLLIIDLVRPCQRSIGLGTMPSRFKLMQESLQICIALVIGFLIGLMPVPLFVYVNKISEIVLILLLFFVGLQLRFHGIPLKQIMMNKVGLMTTMVVLSSALLGGYLAANLLGFPVKTGLALSSTFGWYSLSSILMTDAHGPIMGSIAFFNDLLRELIAILLIPSLMGRYRITALGLCGATSMDFTLPLLQKAGGISIVPAAIVQGFILSLLVPILLTLFNY